MENMGLEKFDFCDLVGCNDVDSLFDIMADLVKYEFDTKCRKSESHIIIDNKIVSSAILGSWQNQKTPLADTPLYKQYLKNYVDLTEKDYLNLTTEIQEKGVLLPPGQLLFRGAITERMDENWCDPLSTTIHPRIATYHGFKHWENRSSRPCITIAAIVVPSDVQIKGIIGPFGEEVEFGQEYEVLTNFGFPPNRIQSRNLNNLSLELLSW